jgi:hypothetical protein
MDTPLLDSLVKYQFPSETYPYIPAFIGRLFYDVGEKDEWQIASLIKGDSGTGCVQIRQFNLSFFFPSILLKLFKKWTIILINISLY